MKELSKSQRARTAIATYKTLSDALILRGSYKPSGQTGRKLEEALRQFSPEIYGSMKDPRMVELKGLKYVIERLPRGIEGCNKIVLTAQEELENTSFEEVRPLRRRRVTYIVSEKEICFVVTRGTTEIYDILTHLTFLNIEAQKIYNQACNENKEKTREWLELESIIEQGKGFSDAELDKAIWNVSIILGRTYKETRETYEDLEKSRTDGYNNGLFHIVYALGNRIYQERYDVDELLTINFTPSLQEILGHHKYSSLWALSIKEKLISLNLHQRPIHLVSANMHSFRNLLYGRGALKNSGVSAAQSSYEMVEQLVSLETDVDGFASRYGFTFHKDESGSNIDVQIIDTSKLDPESVHPDVTIDFESIAEQKPVIVIIDYAFGAQAYEIMDEMLSPSIINDSSIILNFSSLSIMGKAGILPGKKGDIMLATAHVMEGTPHNYIFENDLSAEDFQEEVQIFSGPMLTVLGTSLQNRDVLERFHSSSWSAIGLEMEGGHYQRAISAAIIQGNLSSDIRLRYAYYASDNPLVSGETLASGPMGSEGIFPTYLISKVILEKISTQV
ncbi:MAG: hypothetical protein D6B25_06095 [Desulfobulbaceae bacterium]|mgnify:CR=1 FL=1|nr:MAG: hypothetical protein D6B25_06095 [Desulfobulbaceae bacterium]